MKKPFKMGPNGFNIHYDGAKVQSLLIQTKRPTEVGSCFMNICLLTTAVRGIRFYRKSHGATGLGSFHNPSRWLRACSSS